MSNTTHKENVLTRWVVGVTTPITVALLVYLAKTIPTKDDISKITESIVVIETKMDSMVQNTDIRFSFIEHRLKALEATKD